MLARVANTRHASMVNIWGTTESPPKHPPLRNRSDQASDRYADETTTIPRQDRWKIFATAIAKCVTENAEAVCPDTHRP